MTRKIDEIAEQEIAEYRRRRVILFLEEAARFGVEELGPIETLSIMAELAEHIATNT